MLQQVETLDSLDDLITEFWLRVPDRPEPLELCWVAKPLNPDPLWFMNGDRNRYPSLRWANRLVKMSHIALHIAGERRGLAGSLALHNPHYCDRETRCVRPEHLRWGTSAENQIDGRENIGLIRDRFLKRSMGETLLRQGVSRSAVAVAAGVTEGTVARWARQAAGEPADPAGAAESIDCRQLRLEGV